MVLSRFYGAAAFFLLESATPCLSQIRGHANTVPDFMDERHLGYGSLNPSCKANARCSGLAGNCCPTEHGVMLDCCLAQCSRYPVCAGEGLEGACCPTIDDVYLDCCHPKKECSANVGCKGLAGDCCPTQDGKYLACCAEQEPIPTPAPQPKTPKPTRPPTDKPTTAVPTTPVPTPDASCSAYPVCKAKNLIDNCCPSANGEDLYCCNPPPRCEHNPGCSEYSGECCPTPYGVYRSCCAES